MEKRKILPRIILIVCAIVFLAAAIILIFHLMPRNNEPTLPEQSSSASSDEQIVLAENPIDFSAQRDINEEICAWISVPNANVDYPILQSTKTPENFYLDHNKEGKYSVYGEIYIQNNNVADFSDSITVVYGHNMKNRTMFGSLRNFRDAEFFKKNDKFYVYTPGHILSYKIYSAFVYDDRHILNSFDMKNREELQKFIDQTLSPTAFVKNVREGIEVGTDDKIVVLSTCTGVDTQRFLVVGVLIDDTATK